jgi:hypothetical protein
MSVNRFALKFDDRCIFDFVFSQSNRVLEIVDLGLACSGLWYWRML